MPLSSAIHTQLPVVPYNAFNPPPQVRIIHLSLSQSMLLSFVRSAENLEYHAQEFALMKSDPPIAQRRSPVGRQAKPVEGRKSGLLINLTLQSRLTSLTLVRENWL
jgi:hypothetical protein